MNSDVKALVSLLVLAQVGGEVIISVDESIPRKEHVQFAKPNVLAVVLFHG